MAPCGESGSERPIQFQDSPFGIALVQDHLVLGEADEQAIETDAVELAGHAVAELVSGGDEGVGEGAAVTPHAVQRSRSMRTWNRPVVVYTQRR